MCKGLSLCTLLPGCCYYFHYCVRTPDKGNLTWPLIEENLEVPDGDRRAYTELEAFLDVDLCPFAGHTPRVLEGRCQQYNPAADSEEVGNGDC